MSGAIARMNDGRVLAVVETPNGPAVYVDGARRTLDEISSEVASVGPTPAIVAAPSGVCALFTDPNNLDPGQPSDQYFRVLAFEWVPGAEPWDGSDWSPQVQRLLRAQSRALLLTGEGDALVPAESLECAAREYVGLVLRDDGEGRP